MRNWFIVLGLLVTIFGVTPSARAADQATQPAEPSHPFEKGSATFSLTSGGTFERNDASIYLANVTGEYASYVADGIALGMQGVGYYGDHEEVASGVGLNIMARWNFLRFDRVSFYGDIVGGTLYLDANFPENGTHLNFTYQGGAGMTIQLNDSLHLVGGARFTHVSNFFIDGRDRNPVFNSYGGYVGLMWTLQ
jgi:hypothetical protein